MIRSEFGCLSCDENPLGVAGIQPREDSRPQAKRYGTCTANDSHAVNWLTIKHLREVLPDEHLLLPSPCLQHHTGRAAADVADCLGVFTRIWLLSKTFAEGDFHQDLMDKVSAVLEDEDDGLEIVDPEYFVLDPADIGREFTKEIVDRCFTHPLGPGEDELGAGAAARLEQDKTDFVNFFPVGWNRHRPLHLCPAGCCGPTPCYSREVSLVKANTLVKKVVFKCITQPAKNKWTKMDPAFSQATLVVCFFALVRVALEAKVRVTYAALTASGQVFDEDEAAEDEQNFRGRMMRYGKRSLAFVGDDVTRKLMLVWVVVGQVIMIIHYRLFKHVTWFSHSRSSSERCDIFDFCTGADQVEENVTTKALGSFAKMIFDPNGAGRCLLVCLIAHFGAPVHWPGLLMRIFQRTVIVAFCKIWRSLFRHFRRYPYLLAEGFHPGLDLASRRASLRKFKDARECCKDPWMGRPLDRTCSTVEDLLDEDMQEYVRTMFLRCMITSTFAERMFAPLTKWTNQKQSRLSLHQVGAKLVNTLFEEAVERWWKALPQEIAARKVRTRSPVAYPLPQQHHKCAWHAYVAEHKPEPGLQLSLTERMSHINSQRTAFALLPAEEQYLKGYAPCRRPPPRISVARDVG